MEILWFLLIGVLVAGYAILDGFDLGAGIFHLFSRHPEDRKRVIHAIGPVWDGNEVWLLTAGGAMFAAFPLLYATVFSGFYLAFVLLLLALIFRAVSLEFSYHGEGDKRGFWGWAFGLGNLVPALLFGVAVGNVMRGLPIAADGSLNITLLEMLNPFSLLMGLFSVALFSMHGAIYMAIKSKGETRERAVRWINGGWMATVLLWLVGTVTSYFAASHLYSSEFLVKGELFKVNVLGNPLFYVLLVLLLACVAMIPIFARAQRFGRAFIASSLVIVSQVGLLGLGFFPRWVPSSVDPNFSLTLYNTASTEKTLITMLVITLIALPFVLGYTIWMYRVFAPSRDK